MWINSSVILNNLTLHELAIVVCIEAIDILKRLVASGRKELENALASAHINLGVALAGLTQYEEAIDEYNHAIKILKTLTEENNIAAVYMNLGNALRDLTRHEEAIVSFCQELWKIILSSDPLLSINPIMQLLLIHPCSELKYRQQTWPLVLKVAINLFPL